MAGSEANGETLGEQGGLLYVLLLAQGVKIGPINVVMIFFLVG